MRLNARTKSLHYFHAYAVADRIPFNYLDNKCAAYCLPSRDFIAKSLLPTPSDDEALKSNLKVIISRFLVVNLKFFEQCFADLVSKHIKHRRYSEMSSKSTVVRKYLNCLHNAYAPMCCI